MVNDPDGKFIRTICTRCGNSQIFFGKSSVRIKCSKCNKLLIEPKGGKTRVRTIVKEVFKVDEI
ncbi:MAG: 30S ribosomal protein S27e [archaeon]